MPKRMMCQECDGSGIGPNAMPDDNKACQACGGSGYIETEERD